MTDTIDTTAEELAAEHSTALAAPARPSALAVTPTVGAGELVARLDVIREAMQTAMVEGVDYGRIPGVDKPTLFKPGAEKLGVLFQLDIQLASAKSWGPGEHLTVETKATVYHAPTKTRLGFGEGLATTREKKHAKRKQERLCPACGMPAVIAGKKEFGGGWLCWKKRDGCGAKFPDGDPAIEGQEVGTIENPDLPDSWNPVVKMAAKRARVDAVLAVTGASALFTQDAEDAGAPPAPEPPRLPAWVAEVKRTVREKRVTTEGVRNVLRASGVPVGAKENPVPLVESLTEAQARGVLERLRGSDVPAPAENEFRHAPPSGSEACEYCGEPPSGHADDGACPVAPS